MSLATFEDVQDRYYRELTPEDRRLVETRLKDAEEKIRLTIQDLDYQIEQNPALADTVIRVTSDAVIRLIQNPEGYTSESDGNYSYELQRDLARGKLSITDEEWADLGIRKKITVIHMAPERPSGMA